MGNTISKKEFSTQQLVVRSFQYSLQKSCLLRFNCICFEINLSEKEKIKVIIQYLIRILKIKLGWINDFDKIIIDYVIEQLTVFKGHKYWINSVKYGSNGLLNTILSGSDDYSIRLWDIRSSQQIQMFNGHTDYVRAVEYSPFVVDNTEVSDHMIIQFVFWDIRSNKKELYMIYGADEDGGIRSLKLFELKNKNSNGKSNNYCVKMLNIFLKFILFSLCGVKANAKHASVENCGMVQLSTKKPFKNIFFRATPVSVIKNSTCYPELFQKFFQIVPNRYN
ncbi:WD-40 repeat protein [Reticulomyxa filosa]|uniref:WD-40 repeat protein n=1 Tax=Reticulomyxa filosa TaxID=46433 RepID=X6LPB2_RETFI|nr:WD-40 repeat protein [Reticulomyxa filosa]|eukprot:ETO03221.1 WD-40 repeat protein [Reticulomyxa filosa]